MNRRIALSVAFIGLSLIVYGCSRQPAQQANPNEGIAVEKQGAERRNEVYVPPID